MNPKTRFLQLAMIVLGVFSCLLPATFALAQAKPATPATPAEAPVVVLDTRGFWRIHQTMGPPMVAGEGGVKPYLRNAPALDEPTPGPAANWTQIDFDDSRWARMPALRSTRTPYLSRLCLRGTFEVTDPSQVADLAISADFHGGAIVYINGKELTREGVADGPKPALAKPYPLEAFTTDGKLVTGEAFSRGLPEKERQRLREARTRNIQAVKIPNAMLRKGVNVLAVEFIRAPYNQVVLSEKRFDLCWGTCEIRRIQMTASTPRGLVPNAVRPNGLQVWNSDPLAPDFDLDWGNPNEPLQPIELVAARNGIFSGKVVVGSTAPIVGLKATVAGALNGPAGASIPASAIQIRYALPWGEESTRVTYNDDLAAYPRGPVLLSALSQAAPATVEVVQRKAGQYDRPLPNEPEVVMGAVMPVWVTVAVPADAKPGEYTGSVKIQSQGAADINVPVKIKVSPWALPSPVDYSTWVELMQIPDTLAQEYEIPLWSDKHWQLIEQSMKMIAQTGSRVVYIPLIAETNAGNAESMVRWIRKGDGTYEYDFSVMEKYIDLATRTMGKPKLVIFEVWELYILDKEKYSTSTGQTARAIEYLESRGALQGNGPSVTLFDPATKETKNVFLPGYGDTESVRLWKPLMEQVRKRLADRGLQDVGLLGTISDVAPRKEEVALFHQIAPGMSWVCHSHHGWGFNGKIYDMETVAYQTRVWNIGHYFGKEGEKPGYGWNRPYLMADYERHRNLNSFPPTTWRHMAEFNITGDQRGIGRIGADNWPAMRDARGNRSGTVGSRYPHSSRRNLDLFSSTFAPGPDGPVATQRFEALREGIQESEARIYIEKALTDEALLAKLGDDLAKRCQVVLRERLLHMWRGLSNLQLTGPNWYVLQWRGDLSVAGSAYFLSSDWHARTAELYDLAAEVQKKTGR